MSLQSTFEGVDFAERQRELTFTKLTHTWFKGETNCFNMEKFINTHKGAHKMIEDTGYNGGMGMDEATKIQQFKSGIKVDAGLKTALTSADLTKYSTFTAISTYLPAEVEHKQLYRTQLKQSNFGQLSKVRGGRHHQKSLMENAYLLNNMVENNLEN